VEAIYSEYELPAVWEHYAAIDALWYRDKEAAREQINTAKKAS
jgi:hypothetical protein